MTWEIFLGIVALVGFVGTVGAWIFKLSGVLKALEVALSALKETLDQFRENAKDTHKELFHKTEENTKKLADHDKRIFSLEEWKKEHDGERH